MKKNYGLWPKKLKGYLNKKTFEHGKKLFLVFWGTLLLFTSYSQTPTTLTRYAGSNSTTTTFPKVATANSTLIKDPYINYGNGLSAYNDNRFVWTSTNAASSVNPSTAPYLSYKFTVLNQVNLDRFVIHSMIAPSGGKAQLRWSTDNYASSLGEFTPNGNNYTLTSVSLSSLSPVLSGIIEFRVFFYNATGNYWLPGNLHAVSIDGTSSDYDIYTGFSIWEKNSPIPPPKLQDSSIVVTTTSTDSFSFSWVKGNGKFRMVTMTPNSSITNPVDGIKYIPNNVFKSGSKLGSNTYCVYNDSIGNGTENITVTGLDASLYCIRVYSYDTAGGVIYNTATAPDNPKCVTAIAPPKIQDSSIVITYNSKDSFSLKWTKGTGKFRMVVMNATSGIVDPPINGTKYNPDKRFGMGSKTGGVAYCVYNDSIGNGPENITITNLAVGFYCIKVFSYDTIGGIKYNTAQSTDNPFCVQINAPIVILQDSNISVTNVTKDSMDISWVKGSEPFRIVMMKENGTGSDVPPVNGTSYNPNNHFGQGSEIGTSGWFCVYKDSTMSTPPNVNIGNLKPNTNYCIRVFSYRNPSSLIYTTTQTKNNPLCVSTSSNVNLPESNLVIGNKTDSSVTISWQKGTAKYRMLSMIEGAGAEVLPANGTKYIPDNSYGKGTQIGSSAWYCVYNDSTSSIPASLTLSGLKKNTDYCIRFYTYESLSSLVYLPSQPATGSSCFNLTFSEIGEVKPTTVITPNGDGANDTWVIDNATELKDHEIIIYNIFGQEVFNQVGYDNEWNGKKDGNPLPDAEYYYLIKGSKVNIKGAIMLINK